MSEYYYDPSSFVRYAVTQADKYGGFAGENARRPHNNSYDAYRHALLSAILTKNIQRSSESALKSGLGISSYFLDEEIKGVSKAIGNNQAKSILDDHENISNKPANMSIEDWNKEVNMDKWNNAVGQREYYKWDRARSRGETQDTLEKWIYDAVKRGDTINNLKDNRVFTESVKISFKEKQEQSYQYAQADIHKPSPRIEYMPPHVRTLFNDNKALLTEFCRDECIAYPENKTDNIAMAMTAACIANRMPRASLIDIEHGEISIAYDAVDFRETAVMMDKAAATPVYESMNRIEQTEQMFEQQRQLAQSQSRGMSLS